MPEIVTSTSATGVAEVSVDYPPVNALPAAAWHDLARQLRAAGEDAAVRVVILAARGRGFNAGVDIKELRDATDFAPLVAVNRGCAEAFAAVYECPVPVIAAVQGHCVGGGIGLVGNCDVIIAADDATFGLPEVDRGALGAATHLSRLVPLHMARAMVYTASTVTAAQLHAIGSVWAVVPAARLHDSARAIAEDIAAKDPVVIRAAKACLNGIDPWDVKRSYRYEQGYTFELNLLGVSDRLRASFGTADTSPDPASEDRFRDEPS